MTKESKGADGFEGIELFERTFAQQINDDGEIEDLDYMFKEKFGSGENQWPVEAGRYRLVWMPGCPHAHKVVIVRKLLGLDKAISLATTGILRTPKGWVFSEDPGEVDPVLKIHYLHDIYTRKDPDYTGRSTVPTIVDTKTGQGVNNDHFWIPIYFETDWKPFHKKGAPDLYPKELREDIDKFNSYVYHRINSGVYDIGFSRSQEHMDEAFRAFFEALDFLEEHLSDKRFLFGDYITDTDIRLYPSLARFQVTYFQMFRANAKRLEDHPNLWAYARDLYQTDGFWDTTYLDLIKKHYQLSPHLRALWGNVNGIYAKGPDISGWKSEHGREKLSKDPEHKFRKEDE